MSSFIPCRAGSIPGRDGGGDSPGGQGQGLQQCTVLWHDSDTGWSRQGSVGMSITTEVGATLDSPCSRLGEPAPAQGSGRMGRGPGPGAGKSSSFGNRAAL